MVKTSEMEVVVHPLVLLSVVDHYNRVAKDTKNRVIGILLGSWKGNTLDVANSYAVPFEEDERDPSIWFFDHNYHERMWEMFRKVNAKEKVVGWYHSGPRLRNNDLEINDIIKRFVPNPVLVVVDVQPKELRLPTDSYVCVEEVHDDGTATTKTFNHIRTNINAEEAEEIGVEHLLRDIKDNAVGTLSTRVTEQLTSLRALVQNLRGIQAYLAKVASAEMPMNHQIVYLLQDVFNLLPNLNVPELVTSFSVKNNDEMLVIYLSSLIRSILALHKLINNKHYNQDVEKEAKQTEEKEKEKKEKKEKLKGEKQNSEQASEDTSKEVKK